MDELVSQIQETITELVTKEEKRLNKPLEDIVTHIEEIEEQYQSIKKLGGFSKQEVLLKKDLCRLSQAVSEISPEHLTFQR